MALRQHRNAHLTAAPHRGHPDPQAQRRLRRGYAAALLLALLPAVVSAAPAADVWAPAPKKSSILPVDQAFRLLPLRDAQNQVHVEWDIAPGCYLYRDRLRFTALDAAGHELGSTLDAQLPQGEWHDDALLGRVQIYRTALQATLNPPPGSTQLRVRYQGCADQGLCYPPQDHLLALPTATAPASGVPSPASSSPANPQ